MQNSHVCLSVLVTSIAHVATQQVLTKERVPQDWSPCEFLHRVASYDPFVLRDAVPERCQRLTTKRLVELAGPEENVYLQASGNGFIGPNNYDNNILFEASMADLGKLIDAGGEALRKARISVQVAQSKLPEKLREFIWDSLPTWLPFPARETRLWIDVPGSPRGTFIHHDSFHNVYMMLNGTKTFQLIPPWQSHLIRVAELDANYLYTNDHWRWLAKTAGTLRAHASWHSMAADSSGPANLASATRFVVTLHPGDVLVMPRGWWHTTMQDGQESAVAINFWFDTRNPIDTWLYRSQVDLQHTRESTPLHVPTLQSGTSTGLTEGVSRNTFYGFQGLLKQVVPWSNFTYLETYPDQSDEPPLLSASWHGEAQAAQCIRWHFDSSVDVERSLRLIPGATQDAVNISQLLEIVRLRRGARGVWDSLRDAYLNMMGGNSWQPMTEWREKMQKYFAEGIPPLPVDMREFHIGISTLQQEAANRAMNTHTLFGLLRKCDEGPEDNIFKRIFALLTSVVSAHDEVPHLPTPHPVCDRAYRDAVLSLVGACRCEVQRCPVEKHEQVSVLTVPEEARTDL